jgi:predicted nucleic acid-binding protein
MHCLLDTNTLLRGLDRNHPNCRLVRRAIVALRRQGALLSVAPQNLIEFWAVATRPVDVNGLGMSPAWAAAQLRNIKHFFNLLPDAPETFQEWERLVIQHQVVGKKTHDARLVAAMNVHGISHILTFNGADFSRYATITVIEPHGVVAKE